MLSQPPPSDGGTAGRVPEGPGGALDFGGASCARALPLAGQQEVGSGLLLGLGWVCLLPRSGLEPGERMLTHISTEPAKWATAGRASPQAVGRQHLHRLPGSARVPPVGEGKRPGPPGVLALPGVAGGGCRLIPALSGA